MSAPKSDGSPEIPGGERQLLLDSLERAAKHYAAKKRMFLAASLTYYGEAAHPNILHDPADPRWVVYEAAIHARNLALEALEHSADRLLAYDSEIHPAAAADPAGTVAP